MAKMYIPYLYDNIFIKGSQAPNGCLRQVFLISIFFLKCNILVYTYIFSCSHMVSFILNSKPILLYE